MFPRLASRILRRVRRAVAPIAAALLAIVVLVGVTRAGARYFYCPMMRAVIDAPCCEGDERSEEDQTDSVEVRSQDCCEEHVLAKLPSGAASHAPPMLDAPLLAVSPPVTVTSRALAVAVPSRFEHENRAGPSWSARHRAELMVFLN